MNDLIPSSRVDGQIILDGENINDPKIDVVTLRTQGGNGFSETQPISQNDFRNVAYGLRVNGVKDRDFIAERVEKSFCRPPSGMRSRTGCTAQPWVSPAVSSSGCASRAPWRWNPKSFSWMNRHRLWIRSPPRRSRSSSICSRRTTPLSSSPTTCSRQLEFPTTPHFFTWVN